MALLNSTYSLQQGFYAGVFPTPLSNYSGFSLVGLRMQPSLGALSSTTMSQLTTHTFPGGSAAAAAAAAATFGMENLRAIQGLRPVVTNTSTSPGSYGDKRNGVTDFSIDGILGRRESDGSGIDVIDTTKIKQPVILNGKHGVSNSGKPCLKDPLERRDSSKRKESEDDDSKTEPADNPLARFSWLQCTRYKPPRLPRTKRKDGAKKRKLGRNPRVPFSPTQVATLEQKFRCTHYLSSIDVAELSSALNLSENRVKIWFQNRRARERRDKEAIDPKHLSSNSNLIPSSPSPLSQSPHTAISPLSSASPSTTVSTPAGVLSFTAQCAPVLSTPLAIQRQPSPLSPSGSISPTQPRHSVSGMASPAPPTHHHHLSLSTTDPDAVSAFTPVSCSLK